LPGILAEISIPFRALESLPPYDRMIAGIVVVGIGVAMVTWFARRLDAKNWQWPVLFWVAASQAVIFVLGFALANPYLRLLPPDYELLVPLGSLLFAAVLLKTLAPKCRVETNSHEVPPLARRCAGCNRVLPAGTDLCLHCDMYVPPPGYL
jgi:hypothetical protein